MKKSVKKKGRKMKKKDSRGKKEEHLTSSYHLSKGRGNNNNSKNTKWVCHRI